MKTRTCEVKSKSDVLGEAEFAVYDTVAEATEAIGDEALLSLLNAQLKTNAMNTLRTLKTKGPAKGWLRDEAVSEIVSEISANPSDFPGVVGNKPALTALVEKRMNEIEARMKSGSDEDGGEEE